MTTAGVDTSGGVSGDLSRAFSVYRQWFIPLFTLSLFSLPTHLVALLGTWSFLLLPLMTVYGAFVFGAMVVAAYAGLRGGPPRIDESLSAAWAKMGPLLEFTLRSLGAFAGLLITVVGIPFAIRLLVRWFFGTEAIMIRDTGGKDAIGYSCGVVTGRWWHVASLILLLALIFAPFSIVGFFVGTSVPWILIQAAVLITISPMLTVFWTSAFLRLEHEAGLLAEPTQESGTLGA